MPCQRSNLVRVGSFMLLTAMLFAGAAVAAASTEIVTYSFPRGTASITTGCSPSGALIADSAGNFYGTTAGCGAFGAGTVFELVRPVPGATKWTETVLYSFAGGSDGAAPLAGVIFDAAGNLYGTTREGGAPGFGTVFKLTPPAAGESAWTESILYTFQGGTTDGAYPQFQGVVFDHAGNLYGVTPLGGIDYSEDKHCGTNGCGVIYELTPPATAGNPWTETILHYFNGGQGSGGAGTPIFDAKGNLYGAAIGGGVAGRGLVYRLTPPPAGETAWTFKVLYAFGGVTTNDAAYPQSSLTLHGSGVLYGTADGGQYGVGTVFQLTPPSETGGAWTESILHNFGGTESDGAFPQAVSLLFDKSGNIYGTTSNGGGDGNSQCTYGGCGTVFELSPPAAGSTDWTETILHSFPAVPKDGMSPNQGVIFGKNGNLYGVTPSGGAYLEGGIFSVVP
jgi:uncharacterized repeat protein (TIGR03803 family)